MDNDEKTASRGDETLPTNGNPPPPESQPEPPVADAAPKGEHERKASAKTVPFPGPKASASSRLDETFGIPDFSFFDDPPEKENKSEPAQTAAEGSAPAKGEAAGMKPPQEGTGWETVGSIMKSQSLRARIEAQEVDDAIIGQLFTADDEAPGETGEDEKPATPANVTPFPGPTRNAERTPADLLRSSGKTGDIFDDLTARAGEAEAAASLEAPSSPDALADAVQSALRNIYGGYAEPQEARPDLSGYTVAEALANADASLEEAALFEERALSSDWQQGSRARDYDADSQSADSPETEGVLDYLYSQRRQERAASASGPQISPEMSLSEYAARSGITEKWQSDEDGEEQPRRVMPFPARDRSEGFRGRTPELATATEPSIVRGGFFPGEAARPVLEPEWGQPYGAPQNARGTITPTYAPTIATPADQLPMQGPDSGHLLGAAGLGLIGGIALAGVLAVFVFNSFVDETGQTLPETTSKVVERLAPAQTASNPIESRSAPERAAEETAPAQAAPEPAPAPAPQRSAALTPPAPPPSPAPAELVKPQLTAASASGAPNTPIRLSITMGEADVGDALVSLKGLPKEAKLSTGIDVGGGQWLLPPSKLKDLTVSAPPNAAGKYSLEAQLLKDDAQTSLSEAVPFTLSIIAGVVAKPTPAQPAPNDVAPSPAKPDATRQAVLPDEAPLPETDFLTQMLIRDGNKKMREGDIAGARRLYEQAAASGNPEAALAMGRSFDPTYFEKLNVKTGKPDPATAFEWYKKALDGGLVTAKVKIDALKQWLQR